jgi:CBS domain-containing protein
MKVGNFCNRDVVITDRDTSILDAAKLMRHHHVGDIVVVENLSKGNIPIGIITDRDIVVELAGELVGIITLDDMIEVIAEQLSTLTLISGREHQIEVERRA